MLRLAALLFSALALAISADLLIFRTDLYRRALDPSSSTGSFESSLARVRALPSDSRRDVLVLGDSRIYSGLDPAVASAVSGNLRFLNAAIPGTTPRCWFFYLRAADPDTNRYRAIVIPVDTYADDDSAIGSGDANDRDNDLHYTVFRAHFSDIPLIAGSFDDAPQQWSAAFNLALRGPLLSGDVQDFLTNPIARFQTITAAYAAGSYDPLATHPRPGNLRGLRVDFARNSIVYPNAVSPSERDAIALEVLHVAQPSPWYAQYRQRWLGDIIKRYRNAGVPVILVRIPTRPAHRGAPAPPSGSIVTFVHDDGAELLPQARYVALERPELFADHNHINTAGGLRFSRLLGTDVARALAHPERAPAAAAAFVARAPEQTPRALMSPAVQATTPPAVQSQAGTLDLQLRFQSPQFWMFFVVVILLFYASPRRVKWIVLLLASYLFYLSWNTWYVVFLFALTVSDYGIAIVLDRATQHRRLLLALGVAANLAFLGAFKYANFATNTAASLLGIHVNPWLVSWIVPIGISFHTFQSISYLVDVYRQRMPAVRAFLDYALYLAFFPQLLAGPIVRAELFFQEFVAWRAPNSGDLSYGTMRILFGLVKKMAIADQFAPISDRYFGAVASYPGTIAAWVGALAFCMQIYFDFSGYSDIAIGCARFLGFVFPENFAQPYLASSVTEFWHRWHMSLSTWLRDYLYIPLGGGRHGLVNTLRNLTITMLLGGLWHGANWTFVAWGGLHGIYLSIERLFGVGRGTDKNPSGIQRWARAILTFALVTLAWVLFRATSFSDALHVYTALLSFQPGTPLASNWPGVLSVALGLTAVVLFAIKAKPALRWESLPFAMQACSLAALVFVFQFFWYQPEATQFIYFKF